MTLCLLLVAMSLPAQVARKEIRSGNKSYSRNDFKDAERSFQEAVDKDSLSLTALYDLSCSLYRQNKYEDAAGVMEKILRHPELLKAADESKAADVHFNYGNILSKQEKWKEAVEQYKECLKIRPEDRDAKENYLNARKHLPEDQSQGGGGQNNQDQSQDNQKNDQGQDQNQDNGDNKQNQSQDNQNNKDNKQDQQNKQDNQDKSDQNNKQNQDQNQDGQDRRDGQSPKVSAQQAQQMLNAIQAKEKETQDKVARKKAAAVQGQRRLKNW